MGFGAFAAACLPWFPRPGRAESPSVTLRILSTTDLHGYLAPFDYYRDAPSDHLGLGRLATLIRTARAETRNTLLFDNGDLTSGNPLCDYIFREKTLKPGDVHPVYKAMNLLGYDAATLGNHDFNNGLPFLERALSGAAFPYVCANVFRAGGEQPYFCPYSILDRDLIDEGGTPAKVRIGVLGVTPPQVAVWARHQVEGNLATGDIVDTVKRFVPEMKAHGAQLIVVLAHTGFGYPPHHEGEENAAHAVTMVDGVDVVIAGHEHRVFPDASFANLPGYDPAKGTLNGKPAVMAGFYGSHLGVIDLKLARSGTGYAVIDARSDARPLHKANAAPDPEIMRAIEADHRATLDYVRQPVGTISQPLDSYFDLVAPSALLALVADVQIWATQNALRDEPGSFAGKSDLPVLAAIAPFKTGKRRFGPGTYTDIEAGDLSMGHIADLYAYPNVLEVLEIDGATLREWLEMSATIFHQIHAAHARAQNLVRYDVPVFDFDVIYGVQYAIDVTRPARYRRGGALAEAGSFRIVDLACDGKPVSDGDRFLIATNNYRAGGGGNFPGLDGKESVYRSPDPMQETIVAWFREKHSWTNDRPAPWHFAGLPDDATIVFETSPEGVKAIPAGSGISFIEQTDEGYGKFRLVQA